MTFHALPHFRSRTTGPGSNEGKIGVAAPIGGVCGRRAALLTL